MHRFYINSLAESGSVWLSKEDSKHAIAVLRLSDGQQITLFDGKGRQAIGRIVKAGKGPIEVEILSCSQPSPVPEHRLEMVVALPKGDRQRVLVDMLVQLGVSSLIPLRSSRCVAQPTQQVIDRLQRTVIESCKQCGRNRLMEVQPSVSIEALSGPAIEPLGDRQSQDLGAAQGNPESQGNPEFQGNPESQRNTAAPGSPAATGNPEVIQLYAHPYARPGIHSSTLLVALGRLPKSSHSLIQVVIGPEGGLTDSECDCLNTLGWQQISLGKNILRIETSATMIAAVWNAWQSNQTVG